MQLAKKTLFICIVLLQCNLFQAQIVDIVQTAINRNLTTLVAAVTQASLVNALKSTGPFTVFAPSDAAFGQLPSGVISDLIRPQHNRTLNKILLYHVLQVNVTSSAITASAPGNVATLQGNTVNVLRNGSTVRVNTANVVVPDVFATNGIVHVIDRVLLPTLDVVEVALTNGAFTTLVAALRAANLVDALQGAGPFTVFAPTDAAFNQSTSAFINDLLQPQHSRTLNKILLYHVLRGNVASSTITATSPGNVTTLQNGTITVLRNGSTVRVNNANVVIPDVSASNGIIHAIDRVLLPPFDVVETALTNGAFTTLVAALRAANLVDALQGAGPFTIFAPNNDAFNKLGAGALADLLKPENRDKLSNILRYHVISRRITAGDIMNLPTTSNATMLNGGSVTITRNNTNVQVNGVRVIQADVSGTNGIIHVIDTVLMPPGAPSSATTLFSQGLLFMMIVPLLFLIW